MSGYAMLVLVLLPVAMYGLALALDGVREWFGMSGLPRARSAIRARGRIASRSRAGGC
jgi:hypothetical protein